MLAEAAPVRIVLTTASSDQEGRRLARALVERRLAACVNLVPNLTSVYRWRGAVEEGVETLLLIKTTANQLPALEAALDELHSYEIPEFLAIAPETASQAYLAWLLNSVDDSIKP